MTTDFLQPPGHKLDLLFVFYNSTSSAPERFSLIQYAPNLFVPLASHDLHVGIVTSNMGAGTFTPPSCPTPGGDQGTLQNQRWGSTCSTAGLLDPAARFLAYAPAADGGEPTVNFTGALADAFACHARIREGSCMFEHLLASMRAALEGCDTPGGCMQPANEGFLRPDAALVVVFLSDEDDCSAPPDSTLFDPSQTTLESELGPLGSYRCFEFGNLCGGVDPGRQAGPRLDCVPGSKDPDPRHQLTPVEDFATFLTTLRPDPGSLYVAVIAAPPGPVTIGLDWNHYPDLQPACTGGLGSADPAPRFAQLLGLLPPGRGRFFSICQPDLSQVMAAIGADLQATSVCLTGLPRSTTATKNGEREHECVVEDRVPAAAAGVFERQLLPRCEPRYCDPSVPECPLPCPWGVPAGASACWFLEGDATCATRLRVRVIRGAGGGCDNGVAPAGTTTVIQCGTCAQEQDGVFDCSPGCAEYWPDECF